MNLDVKDKQNGLHQPCSAATAAAAVYLHPSLIVLASFSSSSNGQYTSFYTDLFEGGCCWRFDLEAMIW